MGEEKGLVLFEDKPMIEHVLLVLESVSLLAVVSSNSDSYNYLGRSIVKDEIIDQGPGAGLVESLKESNTKVNVIAPCDMPHLNVEFMQYMLSQLGSFQAVVPVHKSRIEPLCLVMKKECAPVIEKELRNGVNKLTEIYKSINVNYLKVTGDEPGYNTDLFKNYNSPTDFNQ